MRLRWWIDWSSWLIGIRVDWQRYMRFVVVEFGPVALCVEFDDDDGTVGTELTAKDLSRAREWLKRENLPPQ